MSRRGGGTLYKRGSTWWFQYYRNGRAIRESSESTSEKVARKKLNERLGRVAVGAPVSPAAQRVMIDALLDDLVTEYRTNGRRSLRRMEQLVGHLRDYFGGMRAQNIDTAKVRSYVDERQQAKVGNATINRELADLKRAYSLALKASKVLNPAAYPRCWRKTTCARGFSSPTSSPRRCGICPRTSGRWCPSARRRAGGWPRSLA